jgi:hypothetical protein
MMRARFRRLYGDSPLHLLALIACLLIAGAAIAGWFDSFPGPTTVKILEWFLVAIVAHDLALVPLDSLLDRIAFGAIGGQRRAAPSPERVPGFVYLRVPAMLSGLLGLVFFPEILRLGDSTAKAAQPQVTGEAHQRERQQEEQVDHERRVGAEQRQGADDQQAEVVGALRVVVQVLTERCAQSRVGQVPAVVDDALDEHQVELRVVHGRVPERDREIRAPQLQYPRGAQDAQRSSEHALE